MAHSVAHAQSKQRMVFAQVGAHDQHALQCGQRCDRGAQGAHTFSRRKLALAQAVVDVVRTQAAHQSAGQVQLFDGAVRADQGADAVRTVVALDVAQAIGHVLESGLPIDGFPFTALLEHGVGQALRAIQGFVRETLAVSDPALVDVFVFQGHHTHDLVVLDLNDQVSTG